MDFLEFYVFVFDSVFLGMLLFSNSRRPPLKGSLFVCMKTDQIIGA
jgi:hypothetical protein